MKALTASVARRTFVRQFRIYVSNKCTQMFIPSKTFLNTLSGINSEHSRGKNVTKFDRPFAVLYLMLLFKNDPVYMIKQIL